MALITARTFIDIIVAGGLLLLKESNLVKTFLYLEINNIQNIIMTLKNEFYFRSPSTIIRSISTQNFIE